MPKIFPNKEEPVCSTIFGIKNAMGGPCARLSKYNIYFSVIDLIKVDFLWLGNLVDWVS